MTQDSTGRPQTADSPRPMISSGFWFDYASESVPGAPATITPMTREELEALEADLRDE